jgi:ElaB/YqjD/DUF883 family membrane-anchored ribosome-binding protein
MLNKNNNEVNNMLTPNQKRKRVFEMNKIDVLYRDIENIDDQYNVMFDILSCLDNNELSAIKKRIKVKLKQQKENN